MDRLERKHALDTFKRCQLCGFTSDDICAFQMLSECDENDKPESGNVLVTCKQKACMKTVEDSPRLYIDVPWGQGGPGRFMLVCGDCTFRQGTTCTHPSLKANGGKGLEVRFFSMSMQARVCFADETSTTNVFPTPAKECLGKATK